MKVRKVKLVDERFVSARRFGWWGNRSLTKLLAELVASNVDANAISGEIVEMVVRQWLHQYLSLIRWRVLRYERWDAELSAYQRHIRELDAVCGTREKPLCIFEIGHAPINRRYREKRVQLEKSLEIARTRWKKLGGCLIFVNTGPRTFHCDTDELVGDNLSLDVFALWQMIAEKRTARIVLHIDEVWEFANDHGWQLTEKLLTRLKRFGEATSRGARERQSRRRSKKREETNDEPESIDEPKPTVPQRPIRAAAFSEVAALPWVEGYRQIDMYQVALCFTASSRMLFW